MYGTDDKGFARIFAVGDCNMLGDLPPIPKISYATQRGERERDPGGSRSCVAGLILCGPDVGGTILTGIKVRVAHICSHCASVRLECRGECAFPLHCATSTSQSSTLPRVEGKQGAAGTRARSRPRWRAARSRRSTGSTTARSALRRGSGSKAGRSVEERNPVYLHFVAVVSYLLRSSLSGSHSKGPRRRTLPQPWLIHETEPLLNTYTPGDSLNFLLLRPPASNGARSPGAARQEHQGLVLHPEDLAGHPVLRRGARECRRGGGDKKARGLVSTAEALYKAPLYTPSYMAHH